MKIEPTSQADALDCFRVRVIASLPRLADAFLGSDDDQRSALIVRDHDHGGQFLRVVLLSHGSVALEILHELSRSPQPMAALVSAWRDPDAPMIATLSCTLAVYGRQERFLESFSVPFETDQIEGHGLAALGACEPCYDDPIAEALDVSLVGAPTE